MSTPCENCGNHIRVCMDCDFYKGKYIKIPDNITNGQVIQTLFKPNHIERTKDNVIIEEYMFNKDWWNLPYNI